MSLYKQSTCITEKKKNKDTHKPKLEHQHKNETGF